MAYTWIAAFFSESGVPKLGLSPTIDIWEMRADVQVVDSGSMVERGNGWYVFNFDSYDQRLQYLVTIDGSDSLPNLERYKFQILSYRSKV